jgi:hypothetical protein
MRSYVVGICIIWKDVVAPFYQCTQSRCCASLVHVVKVTYSFNIKIGSQACLLATPFQLNLIDFIFLNFNFVLFVTFLLSSSIFLRVGSLKISTDQNIKVFNFKFDLAASTRRTFLPRLGKEPGILRLVWQLISKYF